MCFGVRLSDRRPTMCVGGVCFLGKGYRLVVSQSRRPVVSWSYWRATQAFSVILRRSQALPVNRAPSSRPVVSLSRRPR